MSYARFSSDDFRSDVYIYGTANGGTKYTALHVASNRHDFDHEGLPEVPPMPGPDAPEDEISEWSDAWLARHQEVGERLKDAPLVPIDHSLAGFSYDFEDPAECADFCVILQEQGFHIPYGVIEALRESDWKGEYAE